MPHLTAPSGIEWFYDDGDGESGRMPLLFIHGWGVDRRIWRQQLKHFSKDYRVISIDLPGHGKSQWKKVSLESMAHDLKNLLERMRAPEVIIIASSLGGLLALKFYDLYPKHVKKLAFVGTMPKFSRSEDNPHGLDVERIRKLGGHVESDYPSIVNIFFRSLFTKEERDTRRFRWLQKFRQFDDLPVKQALAEYLDVLEKEDLRGVLKKIDVPVQFINGREDEICRVETVERMRALCPRAKVTYFEKCGHFPFLSKAYEFNEVLEGFLSCS